MSRLDASGGTEAEVAVIPDCDLCTSAGVSTPAEYDAKTYLGPWAFMSANMETYAVGALGMGSGQRLDRERRGRWLTST